MRLFNINTKNDEVLSFVVHGDFRLTLYLSCYACIPTLVTYVKHSVRKPTLLITTGSSLTVPFGLVVNASSRSRNPRFNKILKAFHDGV
jgi:hypothetical protein